MENFGTIESPINRFSIFIELVLKNSILQKKIAKYDELHDFDTIEHFYR